MTTTKTVKALCSECGGGLRNHEILREFANQWSQDDESGAENYQIIQCLGCEEIRFRIESWSTYEINWETGEPVLSVRSYPDTASTQRDASIDRTDGLPSGVYRIYKETVAALNSGTLILAGIGLRAIVEAICIDAGVRGKNLYERIDALVEKKLLAEPQAALLHEERFIGNAAAHEVEPPARTDIEDGLEIAETLLSAMYIAEKKAQRLRDSRAKREKKRADKT